MILSFYSLVFKCVLLLHVRIYCVNQPHILCGAANLLGVAACKTNEVASISSHQTDEDIPIPMIVFAQL